ncbi:MAG: GIY-YIG nuclease family protein [Candidatus Omnitrophica bacterium]|jgi:putative endonuclease|nr:GIY-YIG nuclease family protein [Candidatus Omnitrophota bacterium]
MDKSIYDNPWFVYIAECRDRTLYVGIAIDVDRRIAEHNNGDKCRYTRFRKPVRLVYKEINPNYNLARARELELKRFSRKKKLGLCSMVKDPSP